MGHAQACGQRTLALSEPTIRAAGGAVIGLNERGEKTLLVVHRPRYDDWSLPKGKCEPGESDVECATREVEEETGWRCDVGSQIASIAYEDTKGRPKTVVYFLMRPVEGEFEPNEEVDEVRWLERDAAAELLSYSEDVKIAMRALDAGAHSTEER